MHQHPPAAVAAVTQLATTFVQGVRPFMALHGVAWNRMEMNRLQWYYRGLQGVEEDER